jgi:hypothetical protein
MMPITTAKQISLRSVYVHRPRSIQKLTMVVGLQGPSSRRTNGNRIREPPGCLGIQDRRATSAGAREPANCTSTGGPRKPTSDGAVTFRRDSRRKRCLNKRVEASMLQRPEEPGKASMYPHLQHCRLPFQQCRSGGPEKLRHHCWCGNHSNRDDTFC